MKSLRKKTHFYSTFKICLIFMEEVNLYKKVKLHLSGIIFNKIKNIFNKKDTSHSDDVKDTANIHKSSESDDKQNYLTVNFKAF